MSTGGFVTLSELERLLLLMSEFQIHKSPREIYGVFSINLQNLVARKAVTVSQICRDLEVNRTQFNRYLSGQASPRPDVLHKICAYFQTDARILLEPLENFEDSIDLRAKRWFADSPFRQFVLPPEDHLKLDQPIRLGIHRYWQRSSLHKDWVNSHTIRIFKMADATVFRALEDPLRDKVIANYPRQKLPEVHGFVLSQVDGVVLVSFQGEANRISMSYLTSMLTAGNTVYPGIVMITRPEISGATRIARCALEFLPQGPELLPVLRKRGGCKVIDLPDYLAHGLRGKVR